MLAQHAQRSLDTAAARTLERIRTDQAKVNGRLRPLLEHIEQHLFDPGLDVNQLKRRCGVRDNSIPIQFHAQLGQPPHAYIESRRLETACRLLRDTELKVWQIASLLGYSSIQVFSRAFTRWAEARPTSYRRQARRKRAGLVVAEKRNNVAACAAVPSTETINLEHALDGKLEARQADHLIRRLLNLYPATGFMLDRAAQAAVPRPERTMNDSAMHAADLASRSVPTRPAPGPDYSDVLSLEEVETARAEALWEQIKSLSQVEMRAAIRRTSGWETPALFEHVRTRSMVEGRDNRKRGVAVAELLLDVGTPLEETGLREPEAARRASAWTWIGNARTQAWDFSGADQAFKKAESFLQHESGAPRLEGDLRQVQSIFFQFQERLDEALKRASTACDLYKAAGRPDKRARSLTQMASVLGDLGRYEECISTATEAREFFARAQDKRMTLVTLTILGRCFSNDGRYPEAMGTIRDARQVGHGSTDSDTLLKFAWLEAEIVAQRGNLDRAQVLYRDVVEAFVEKERPGEAASAALELAGFLWKDGNDSAVVAILRDVIPTLERLQMKQDALAAFALLEKSATRSTLSKALFDSVKAAIEQ